MGIPVLIYGQSGVGKTTSLRNFGEDEVGIINPLGKPLPFKKKLKAVKTIDFNQTKKTIKRCDFTSYVVDDFGYFSTEAFMRKHSNLKGNEGYMLYNSIADNVYHLVRFITEEIPEHIIVYIMMHEKMNDEGFIGVKTIGRLLDNTVTLEGMFTVALHATRKDKRYIFETQTNGAFIAKSPMEMFAEAEIDNDLKAVDTIIREYYNIEEKNL